MATRIAVLGLGAFGQYLAEALYQQGCEVLGIDRNADLVQALKDEMTQTACLDVGDRDALKTLGIDEMDMAVVAMGSNVATSILLVQYLAKSDVPTIIAKAESEEHAEALLSVGATTVSFPERDAARRLAQHVIRPNVLDYFPVEEGYSIIEMVVPAAFTGKTLGDLHIRNEMGILVLAIQQAAEGEEATKTLASSPHADFRLERGHVMLLYGADADLERIREIE